MKIFLNSKTSFKDLSSWFLCFTFLALTGTAMASSSPNLGSMAHSVTDTFTNVSKLITAGSYVAGLAFALGAIMKFKQHKDNPTQIPIGTPIALTFIAAALLFLPSILGITGATMLGTKGTVGGPTGYIFS